MNKRITSILLCFVVLFSMLVSAVPVYAATGKSTSFTMTPDEANVHPGDIITYTIEMGAVDGIYGMLFELVIPEGLTYVDGSGKAVDGLQSKLSAAKAEFVELTKIFIVGSCNYTSTESTPLMTFQCKVNDDVLGSNSEVQKTVEILVEDEDNIFDQDYDNIAFTLNHGTVTITPKPVAVTGVEVTESLSLKTGESENLTVNVLPADATNKNVTYAITAGDAVTVDENGKVTGVKEGTATITVKTVDGGFTDTCTVTVACAHANKTNVAEAGSDCKTQGWDAYVECDDCGQLFSADGTTEIDEIPFRPLAGHTGGTATCTAQAICSVCGNPYGELAAHSYTVEAQNEETLKTAGNCRDEAVYYYSCSCGAVEGNDEHTFTGSKDASVHVGGTELVNPSEPDHATQTDGYTGDTKCLGCGEIIDTGDPIEVDAHTPADVWTTDGTHHWKVCNVVGCGVVIDGSKAEHTSTGENVATCQKLAVCDVCGVSYGDYADHDWNTADWESDETGHWHKCNTPGCTETNDFAAHTPDHEGGATEEYAIKCSICDYEIEAQLEHVHVFDKEVAEEQYLASPANCNDPAKYYKSCACGAKGTETFEFGTKLGHTEGTEWKSDDDNHWHICSVAGCGVIIETSKAAHTSTGENVATCTKKAVCDVCGVSYGDYADHDYGTENEEVPAEIGQTGLKAHYQCSKCEKYFVDVDHDTHVEKKEVAYNDLIIPALVDNELTIEIPFSVIVEKTGDLDPAKETFTFKMFEFGFEDVEYTVEGLTVETNGVNTYTGKLIIKVKESQLGNLSEGFKFAQVKGDAEGWTYDETVYYIAPQVSDTDVTSFVIFPGDDAFGNTILDKVEFTNSYNKAQEPTQPGESDNDNPPTGDSSMMWLWIVLLGVSGFGVVATVATKKRTVR